MRITVCFAVVVFCSALCVCTGSADPNGDVEQYPIPKQALSAAKTASAKRQTVIRGRPTTSSPAPPPSGFRGRPTADPNTPVHFVVGAADAKSITEKPSVRSSTSTTSRTIADAAKPRVTNSGGAKQRNPQNDKSARIAKAIPDTKSAPNSPEPTSYRISLTPPTSATKVSAAGNSKTAAVTKAKNVDKPAENAVVKSTTARPSRRSLYACPAPNNWQFFAVFCNKDSECTAMGNNWLCCRGRCLQGKEKQREEIRHEPLLGVIGRRCPTVPLAELWFPLRTCARDADCWPGMVCCPDGARSYCRSARHELENLPGPAANIARPLRAAASYLQCTPPPPPVIDFNPRPCNTTADCFPNLCCQEQGKKHCRPPQKNLISLLATMTQSFGSSIWKMLQTSSSPQLNNLR